jgi:Phosphoribosyl transferase domain
MHQSRAAYSSGAFISDIDDRISTTRYRRQRTDLIQRKRIFGASRTLRMCFRRRWGNSGTACELRSMNWELPLPFRERAHAAQLLAERLAVYRGQRPLILAIPRGAAPMGRIIADRLDGDLDLVLVRKLRSPLDEELAIGAIDEFGHVYRLSDGPESAVFGGDADYLDREIARQRARAS